ncbi:hypothetical protein FOXG_18583 [Fusarium oxysporum f. sp. lycopersici 4287]|uniref:Uncharacterized protein n=2 Tax=Fusarium oxysporum TaxID=5507 RepID=A0A0J9UKJ4_FUSO4|nr:hypothetical protein FOXG_18583 [Fusarium oxysporum f. sp. lycopersici 4287]EXK31274.1 hypothetical protein FOMG_13001 [Fusarium oxysporum f. sp. melonis 26406]KNA99734.1 hypothetical protein FOXG_18583 [Fusarium oxysporum f. sp. lycopersici 4287]
MESQDARMFGNLLINPYPHSTVEVIFGDNSIYWISVDLLERYPRFRLSYDAHRGAVKLNCLNKTQTAAFVGYLRNGTWTSRKPEDWDGSPHYYNRMQHYSDFTKMADRLSIFGLVEMLREANWTLQSNQTALAEYFTQRVSMSEEAITEVQIAGLKSETSASRTFANITLVEMGEMKRKVQQYEEKYGPL